MSNSTVFTIGSALRQAENDGVPVRLMVDGEWFDGEVAGLDGDGVLLESPDGEVVVRLTSISVVRLIRMAQEAQPAPVAAAPAPTPTPAPAHFADVVRISGFDQAPEPTPVEKPAPAEPAPVARTVGVVAAQLAAVAIQVDEFDGLPDDVTEAERAALAERRALLAGQDQDRAAEAVEEHEAPQTLHLQPAYVEPELAEPMSDEPEHIEPPEAEHLEAEHFEAEVVEAEVVEPERIEPELADAAYDEPQDHLEVGDEPAAEEESPYLASSTQGDDWRAMLVSLRQEAQDAPHEPEKRRSPWRIAR